MKQKSRLVINILYALAVCFIALGVILKLFGIWHSELILLISFGVGIVTLIIASLF